MVLKQSIAIILGFYSAFSLANPSQPPQKQNNEPSSLSQVVGNHEITFKPLHASQKHRDATKIITQVIESHHYKRVVLDDNMSKEIWQRYLDALDPNHSIFLKSDIDRFAPYATKMDDALLKQDLSAAFEVFNLYEQ